MLPWFGVLKTEKERNITMETKKVMISVVGGFVLGTLLGVLFAPVRHSEGKKEMTRISTEYFTDAAEQHGVYAIL